MKPLRSRAALALAALLLVATACGQVGDIDTNVETAGEQRDVNTAAGDTTEPDAVIARGESGGTADESGGTTDNSEGDSATRTTSLSAPAPSERNDAVGQPAELSRSEGTTTVIPDRPSAPSEADPALDATTTSLDQATTSTSEATEEATVADDPTTTAAVAAVPETSVPEASTTTTAGPTTTQATADSLAAPSTTSTAPPTTQAPTTTEAPTTTIAEAVSVPDPVPSVASGTAQVAMVSGESINVYTDATDATADWTFGRATQFGNPTVFLIAGSSGNRLKVLLPVRQKHTYGWIDQSDVTVSTTDFRAVVDLSSRSVTVYSGTNLISSSKAVIGKSSTPTPVGQFFVTDKLRHANPGGAYGPWILALSARSEALTSFNGGEPIVALHGTNKPWLVGGRHSNGCIRLPNDVITELAQVVPLGTPVDVVA